MTSKERSERIQNVTAKLEKLPTLPAVMMKIVEMADDPDITAPHIARFISHDQSITAKILKLANSPFYGLSQKIGNINLAIVVLGTKAVKDLALAATVADLFRQGDFCAVSDLKRFWAHSIAVMSACRVIVQEKDFSLSSDITTIGLLHDIGKIVFCIEIEDDYKLVEELVRRDAVSTFTAEMALFNFSHADVGGWLIENWSLPPYQVEAIYNHHQPWLSDSDPNIAMIVNFADLLAIKAGYTWIDKNRYIELDDRVINYLELKKDGTDAVDWDYYMDLLTADMKESEGFLSILVTGD